jgi:hypothetical protein
MWNFRHLQAAWLVMGQQSTVLVYKQRLETKSLAKRESRIA